jgi:hypothetical protein
MAKAYADLAIAARARTGNSNDEPVISADTSLCGAIYLREKGR